MTREQAKNNLDVITAFAEGKEILFYLEQEKDWFIASEIQFTNDLEYIINDGFAKFKKAEKMGETIEFRRDTGGSWSKWETKLHKEYEKDGWKFEYRIKPKWNPKAGEIIFVSQNDEPLYRREFICMTKDNKKYVCHSLDGDDVSRWSHAKQIKG